MKKKTTQPIFSRNNDHRKIAFLNWRVSAESGIQNLLNLADGFLRSSLELATTCLTDNRDKKADILIFPILTNANHGIELHLKAIMWIFNKILHLDSRIEGGHNLDQIFAVVKSRINAHLGAEGLKEFLTDLADLEDYLKELTTKIGVSKNGPNMDFSRYPFNNSYDNHFYVDVGNVEVDLTNFVRRFRKIHRKLEAASDGYYYGLLRDGD